jgi:hypothetical protein
MAFRTDGYVLERTLQGQVFVLPFPAGTSFDSLQLPSSGHILIDQNGNQFTGATVGVQKGGVALQNITGRTLLIGERVSAVLYEKGEVAGGEAGNAAELIAVHAAAADPHAGYQKESERGANNGYAPLDGSGLVPTANLPALGSGNATQISTANTLVSARGVVPTNTLNQSLALENFIAANRRVILESGNQNDRDDTNGIPYRLDGGAGLHRTMHFPKYGHVEGKDATLIAYNMGDGDIAVSWRDANGDVGEFQGLDDYFQLHVQDLLIFPVPSTNPGTLANGLPDWSSAPKTIGMSWAGRGNAYPRVGQQSFRGNSGIALAALSGSGVACTSTVDVFMESDVGRKIRSGFYFPDDNALNGTRRGEATITAVGGPRACTVNITTTFAGTTGSGPYTVGDPQFAGRPDATLTFSARGARLQNITITSDKDIFKSQLSLTERVYHRLDTNNGAGHYHIVAITNARTATAYAMKPDPGIPSGGGTVATGSWEWESTNADCNSLTPARMAMKSIKTWGGYVGQDFVAMQYSRGDGFEMRNAEIGGVFRGLTIGAGQVDCHAMQSYMASGCVRGYLFIQDGRDSYANVDIVIDGGFWCKTFRHGIAAFKNSPEFNQYLDSAAIPPETSKIVLKGGTAEFGSPYDAAKDARTFYYRDDANTWQPVTVDMCGFELDAYWDVHLIDYDYVPSFNLGYCIKLKGRGARFRIGDNTIISTVTYLCRAEHKTAQLEFAPACRQWRGIAENVAPGHWPKIRAYDRSIDPTPNSQFSSSTDAKAQALCGMRRGEYDPDLRVDLHPNHNVLVPDFSESDGGVTWTVTRDAQTGRRVSKVVWGNPAGTAKAHTKMLRGWSAAVNINAFRGVAYRIAVYNPGSVDIRLVPYLSNAAKAWQFGPNPANVGAAIPEAVTIWASAAGEQEWHDIIICAPSLKLDDYRLSFQILTPQDSVPELWFTELCAVNALKNRNDAVNRVLEVGAWNHARRAYVA